MSGRDLQRHAGAAVWRLGFGAGEGDLGQREAERTYGVAEDGLTRRCPGRGMRCVRRGTRRMTRPRRGGQRAPQRHTPPVWTSWRPRWETGRPRGGHAHRSAHGLPVFQLQAENHAAVPVHHRGDPANRRSPAHHLARAGHDQDARIHPQAAPPDRRRQPRSRCVPNAGPVRVDHGCGPVRPADPGCVDGRWHRPSCWVLANAWKETVRDAVANIRAHREAAKSKVRRRVGRRQLPEAERKRLYTLLTRDQVTGDPLLRRWMREGSVAAWPQPHQQPDHHPLGQGPHVHPDRRG
jgi:hypothetical protein